MNFVEDIVYESKKGKGSLSNREFVEELIEFLQNVIELT